MHPIALRAAMRGESGPRRGGRRSTEMNYVFVSYWWLLFPLAFFLAGAFRNWLRYLTHRQELEIERLKALRPIQVKDGASTAAGA
jgi:hypothetical protein